MSTEESDAMDSKHGPAVAAKVNDDIAMQQAIEKLAAKRKKDANSRFDLQYDLFLSQERNRQLHQRLSLALYVSALEAVLLVLATFIIIWK